MRWLEWLFPKRCVNCGRVGAYLCAECMNMVGERKEPICPECAGKSIGGRVHARCQRAWGMDGLVACARYGAVVKRVVRKYKFRYVEDMVTLLGEMMVSLGGLEDLPEREWVVVAVPLHVRRERWRGFNQAEVLGRWLAGELGWEMVHNALVRSRYTKTQSELSRKERLKNVRGAFGNGKAIDSVKDKSVALVDDVWTTGATMRECAKVLKRRGAKEVWGLVVGR